MSYIVETWKCDKCGLIATTQQVNEGYMHKCPPTFEVGDTVSAFGVEGKVVVSGGQTCGYQIQVDYGEHDGYFLADGKAENWHREPSLKLVSRPKKKVTKQVEYWVNIYPTGETGFLHESEQEAKSRCHDCKVVKLSGSYEVEE